MYILIYLLVAALIFGQNNSFETFNRQINSDLEAAGKTLDNWGNNKENDPQYYIAGYNYYVRRAQNSNTSEDDQIRYDTELLNQGFDVIKKGIDLFPDHFEMRFGLMYMLRQNKQWDTYLQVLDSTFNYLHVNKPDKIYWNNNEQLENPNEFTISTAQSALFEMLNQYGPIDYSEFFHKNCDLMIKYFPKHKYGYASKAALHYYKKEDADALTYFSKARQIDPNDMLVYFNMAVLYMESAESEKAKQIFNDIADGDSEFANQAKQMLKKMEQ